MSSEESLYRQTVYEGSRYQFHLQSLTQVILCTRHAQGKSEGMLEIDTLKIYQSSKDQLKLLLIKPLGLPSKQWITRVTAARFSVSNLK